MESNRIESTLVTKHTPSLSLSRFGMVPFVTYPMPCPLLSPLYLWMFDVLFWRRQTAATKAATKMRKTANRSKTYVQWEDYPEILQKFIDAKRLKHTSVALTGIDTAAMPKMPPRQTIQTYMKRLTEYEQLHAKPSGSVTVAEYLLCTSRPVRGKPSLITTEFKQQIDTIIDQREHKAQLTGQPAMTPKEKKELISYVTGCTYKSADNYYTNYMKTQKKKHDKLLQVQHREAAAAAAAAKDGTQETRTQDDTTTGTKSDNEGEDTQRVSLDWKTWGTNIDELSEAADEETTTAKTKMTQHTNPTKKRKSRSGTTADAEEEEDDEEPPVVFDRKLDYVLEVLCGYTIRKYNTIIVESLQTNYITDFEQFRMIEPTDLGTVLDMKKKKSTNKYYKYQKKTKQQSPKNKKHRPVGKPQQEEEEEADAATTAEGENDDDEGRVPLVRTILVMLENIGHYARYLEVRQHSNWDNPLQWTRADFTAWVRNHKATYLASLTGATSTASTTTTTAAATAVMDDTAIAAAATRRIAYGKLGTRSVLKDLDEASVAQSSETDDAEDDKDTASAPATHKKKQTKKKKKKEGEPSASTTNVEEEIAMV